MDVREFYDRDPRRQASDEVGFGDAWTTEDDRHATYRINWVQDTGEVYAVREPHPGGLLSAFLDAMHLDEPKVSELRVEILATDVDRATVEDRLAGWEDEQRRQDSLDWARGRLRGA